MSAPLHLVSTFATDFAHGNPAAVVLLDDERESAWCAKVATVLNQPVTAFLQPVNTGYALRWFSPTRELPLCGHGTVAATHVLYEIGAVKQDQPLELTTRAGVIPVRRDDGVCWIALEAFPLKQAPAPSEVLEALGVADCQWFGEGDDDLVVVLDSVAAVEAASPDFESLRALPRTRTIVTAAGGHGVDFTSRVFPPRVGVPEDQVTGTAHAALGPYWSGRLGRTRLIARQASQRGGLLQLDLSRDGVVAMGGRVTKVAEGSLFAS
jgi:PhzF family phenazine biosynthesis protein